MEITKEPIEDAVVVETSTPATVTLTDAQVQVVQNILSQKAYLEAEYKKLEGHQNDVILTIAESKGIKISGQVEFKDKSLIFH